MKKFLVTLSFVVETDEIFRESTERGVFPLNCTQDHLEYILREKTSIEIRDNKPKDKNYDPISIFIEQPVIAVEELRDSYHLPWS